MPDFPSHAPQARLAMRLWSLHPKYLDRAGLLALWREGLLARKVLAGKTKGYRQHPQLERFKAAANPKAAIDAYLERIWEEAKRRGYDFQAGKIRLGKEAAKINLSRGQLKYELEHLKKKLLRRDPGRLEEILKLKKISSHPLFRLKPGGLAAWEKKYDR